MDIEIIKAKPEHTEAVSRICAEGWQQTIEGKYSIEEQKKTIEKWYNYDRVRSDIEKGVYTHVALVDGQVAGTIGGILNKNENKSEIYVFYVDQVYRYKGIGRKLLDVFTQAHMKEGATEQYVSVEEDNMLGIPFYEARGFRKKEGEKRYSRTLK